MFPDNTKYMIHVGVVSTDNTVNTLKLKFVYLQKGGKKSATCNFGIFGI